MGHIGLCVFFFFFCWIAAAALGGEAAPTSRREGGWFVDWEEEAIRSFDNDLEEEYRWIDINERIWKKEAVSYITTAARFYVSVIYLRLG